MDEIGSALTAWLENSPRSPSPFRFEVSDLGERAAPDRDTVGCLGGSCFELRRILQCSNVWPTCSGGPMRRHASVGRAAWECGVGTLGRPSHVTCLRCPVQKVRTALAWAASGESGMVASLCSWL